MKRRQFGAMLATATFTLGGISSVAADASAQETEPLQVEDVSVNLGGVTSSVGQATFAYEDGTMELAASDWSMEGDERALSIAEASVSAEDVDQETYATLRAAMVETYQSREAAPLLAGFAKADVNPDSAVQVTLDGVELSDELVADQITANGTAGSVVPEGTRDVLQDPSLSGIAALGTSEWSELQVQRGDAELVANDVVLERSGAALSITAPDGSATVSDRSFEFSEMEITVSPPETIPAPHVEFLSEVRELASEGDSSLSSLESAAEEAGVTASNTADAVEDAQFTLSFGQVSEGGETVVADFETSGTLAELVAVLRQRT